jgi:hypothetical protein
LSPWDFAPARGSSGIDSMAQFSRKDPGTHVAPAASHLCPRRHPGPRPHRPGGAGAADAPAAGQQPVHQHDGRGAGLAARAAAGLERQPGELGACRHGAAAGAAARQLLRPARWRGAVQRAVRHRRRRPLLRRQLRRPLQLRPGVGAVRPGPRRSAPPARSAQAGGPHPVRAAAARPGTAAAAGKPAGGGADAQQAAGHAVPARGGRRAPGAGAPPAGARRRPHHALRPGRDGVQGRARGAAQRPLQRTARRAGLPAGAGADQPHRGRAAAAGA